MEKKVKAEKKVIRTVRDSVLDLGRRTIPIDLEGADGVHHLFVHRFGAEAMLLVGEKNWIAQLGSKCIKDADGNEVFTPDDIEEIRKNDALTFHKISSTIMEMAKPMFTQFEKKT
jgi:hypothetical protein